MGVRIRELIDIAVEQGVSAWIEYEPIEGFEIHVAYIGKEEMFRMSDSSQKTRWTKHQKETKVDRPTLTRKWAGKGILDWKGLTLGKLRELIPIKVSQADLKTAVPCDEENKYTLLFNSLAFDGWLTEVSTDPSYFIEEVKKRKDSADELKKS